MNRTDSLFLVLYLLIVMFIPPHSCVRLRNRCSATSFPNGRIALRHRGRVGKVICNLGYKLIGDRIATCHEGKWDIEPKCVKDIKCPKQMPKVMNGKMELFNYVYFKVICNPGFRVPDEIQSIFPCEQFYDTNMKPPVCELTADQFCDFETDMCNWNNTVPYFPWIRQQNATPSHALRTGPGGDHTYGTGHYLYIETSGISTLEERYAKLIRRFWKVDTPEVCFVFWFHMYGFNIGTLDVYIDYAKVFTKTGDLGDKWRKGIIQNLPSDRDFYITVVATTGNGYAGDIAIDDIGLVNSTDCTKVLLVETTCKNRCFEAETNSSLCKCSSECLIEASCCSDFMQICGADAPKSTRPSESTEDTTSSQDVDYSTTISNPSSSDDSSTFLTDTTEQSVLSYKNVSSPVYVGSTSEIVPTFDETKSTATDEILVFSTTDEPVATTDSVIKITESRHLTTKHTTRNNLRLVSRTSDALELNTESSYQSTMMFTQSSELGDSASSQGLPTAHPPSPTTARPSPTIVDPVVSVSLRNRENTMSTYRGSTKHSTVSYKPTSSLAETSVPPTMASFTTPLLKNHQNTAATSKTAATTTLPPATTLSPNTKKNISTTSKPKMVTMIQEPPTKPTVKLTTLSKIPETTTSPSTVIKVTISSILSEIITEHPITPRQNHIPSTVAITEDDEDVDDPTVRDTLTPESGEELESSRKPDFHQTINPSQVTYKRRKTYVAKGRYTFSAVKSENKTTTYVTVVAGILIFLAAAFLAGYVFRRRRSHLFRGSAEESDVLYMTSDEILDFNLARRPPSSGTTPSGSTQQILCQTDY